MKTITIEEFYDSDHEEVDSSYWRHGRTVRYLVREDTGIYLTNFLRSHYDDGIQDTEVDLYQAVQVMKPVWEIVK